MNTLTCMRMVSVLEHPVGEKWRARSVTHLATTAKLNTMATSTVYTTNRAMRADAGSTNGTKKAYTPAAAKLNTT